MIQLINSRMWAQKRRSTYLTLVANYSAQAQISNPQITTGSINKDIITLQVPMIHEKK